IEEARRRSTDVPVLWSAKVDRSVLRVAALAPSIGETAFDLGRWTGCATLVVGRGKECLLLRPACRAVRLDVVAGSLLDGPVTLFCEVPPEDRSGPAFDALKCFQQLCRGGEFPPPPS